MGVDYSGHYGLGWQVTVPEFNEEHEFYEDPLSFLYEICSGTNFSYFEVGQGSYTGEQNDLYVIIDEPFENGLDITEKANDLRKFLTDNNIEFEGEIDVVGGLEVY